MGSEKLRIALGGLMHESNTFSRYTTKMADFSIQRGEALVAHWRGTHHEVGGFIAGASRYGYEIAPTMMAAATPSGVVEADVFEALVEELIDRFSSVAGADGVLLALHGALVSEAFPDGDGEIVRRLRQAVGPATPLVVTHDLHANVSSEIVAHCDALVIYKTYPHLDHFERGLQAASIVCDAARGDVTPVQALKKPPLLLNVVHQNTDRSPMDGIMAEARALEKEEGILAASVALGYQYADVQEVGPAVVIVTDGDGQLAKREAERLSELLWWRCRDLTLELPDAASAVTAAMQSDEVPVVLVEMGDNVGGGSPGDSTFILQELLRQRAQGWVVVLADPDAVRAAAAAGVGGMVTLEAGGKQDDLHGEPVNVSGYVKVLHDGRYVETEPRHGGQRYHDQGLTAVLEVGERSQEPASLLALTSRREVPFSLHQLLSLGIRPERQRILVVKAAIAFRAAYEPIAGCIIEVDTPGVTAINPAHFDYRNARRPLAGLPEAGS